MFSPNNSDFVLKFKHKLKFRRDLMKIYDLAIIGAGPVGLFATNFANLHGLNTITFEALDRVGGQVEMLFPNKKIKDIPAYPTIFGKDLIKNLTTNLNSTLLTKTKIEKIEKETDHYVLNNDYLAKTILLTTGLGAFHPKELPIKFDSETAQHIHYFMTDPTIYQNQDVAVLGGGDSALDWALQLASQVKTLTLIHRRDQFRGLETSLDQLKNLKNVKILTPYLPKDVQLDNNLIELTLKQVGEQTELTQKFTNVFVAYGFKSDTRLLRKWGLDLSTEGIKVNTDMSTNLPGIYAVGDNADYNGRVPMIALGFGEAQIAVTSIMSKLFPEKKVTLHSTSI